MDLTDSLTSFDWVIISLVGLLGIVGLLRGFTQEALSLAGWILAIVIVRLFHKDATMWLAPNVGGEAAAAIIGFLVLFFGTVIVARLIAGAAGGFAKRSLLGPMDRVLGLGFGALKGLILGSALFLLAQFSNGLFDPDEPMPAWLMESRTAPLLSLSADAMVGWVRDLQDEKADAGSFGLPPGMTIPPGVLPPGHPPLEQPFGGGRQTPGDQGYSSQDRDALEKLLEQGAKDGEQVEI